MPTSDHYLKGKGYPSNWKEIRERIVERAGNRCEWVDADGTRCPRVNGEVIPGNERGNRTVLTVAHLSDDVSDCSDGNLKAMCQMHHLRYDAAMHSRHAQLTLAKKKRDTEEYHGQLPLFPEG